MTVIRSKDKAFDYQEYLKATQADACHIQSYRTHNEEMGLFERLEKFPSSLSDEDLKLLMNHSGGRGKNARIPYMACNEYERRHSPTEVK